MNSDDALREGIKALLQEIDVRDTSMLMSNPPKNAQAWHIAWRLRALLDAE